MALNNEEVLFWGVELNEEEKRTHRASYATLARQFDCVLCNNIFDVDPSAWDNVECGCVFNYYYNGEEISEEEARELEEKGEDVREEWREFFQFYIVDNNGREWLEQAGEVVLYSEALDVYIWCVDHWGTSWAYVMTSIKFNEDFSSVESWK